MNAAQEKRRRDWGLIIFILPLGVGLMMFVGQRAIRMAPTWSVNGDMKSSIDPASAPKQNALMIPPISNDILTPMSWWDTFLTPNPDSESGGGIVFPPFITFEPSASPSTTPWVSATPTIYTTTPTPVVTGTPAPPSKTPTRKPTDTATPTAPTTCTDPAATNNGGPLPCTYPPTTCTDPAATNNGGPLPCTYPPTTCTDPLATNNGGPLPCTYPPTTCTDPAANNNGGPLPCIYPVPSTPVGTLVSPPSAAGTNTPPDGNVGNITDNTYVVLNVSVNVSAVPDGNYDLAFYESLFDPGNVQLDWIIIGISNASDGSQYYEVFNWYNGVPDTNSNVGDVAGSETDNQTIPITEFHDSDGAGPAPQTGILIDVDNAPSNPPPATYNYVVVISPPGGSGDPAQVDSIVATEVPIP